MNTSFEDLKLNPSIISALKKQQINVPTPVQALAYPAFSEGKDLIVESHTGSGKTLAFLLPLFEKIDVLARTNQAIILAPTHELAHQIHEQIKLLSKNSQIAIDSALIIGEVNIDNQIKKLREKPAIIVGSPGRILDLCMKNKIASQSIHTVILDEADNLLLHNQCGTVKKLVQRLNPNCQIVLCSASMGQHLKEISLPLLKDPTIIRTANQTVLNPMIEHFYIKASLRDKFELLKKTLQTTKASRTLVFVSQHTDTDMLVEKLNYHDFSVATLSGKRSKEERQKALTQFKSGKVNVLLSSDISARGLDVANITHIIHYDMPLTPEDYLHRSGRSARNNNKGTSICFMLPKELGMLRILERQFNIQLHELVFSNGKLKNVSSGDYLIPEAASLNSSKAEKATKTRNKYPKGFNKGKGSSPAKTAPKALKKNKEIVNPEPEAFGTLDDALRLIHSSNLDDLL